MSTPPFLALPAGVHPVSPATPAGPLAGLECPPTGPVRGTALLVPGFTGSKEDFIAVLAPLAAAGYRTLAVDLPGQYESPGPSDREAYSLAGFAAAVLAVAHQSQDRPVHLVGHSLGGLVAREAVLADPLAVGSLCLIGSGPAALPEAGAARLHLFAQVLAEHGLEVLWAAKQALEEEEGYPGPDDPEIAHFLADRFRANTPGSLLAMVEILTTATDQVDALATVAPPTLVLTGLDDDTWPVAQQVAMAERLGASLVTLPGVGHSPAAEAPEVTVRHLTEFWAPSGGRPAAGSGAA